ncbi:DUF523 domain-containing protein [Caminibacter mediatlanticus]|uniref:DUF523 domain-containing protein n=1 Tax=Caminibacter mediatlanticus TB-2 TaxID=391592 RepID=A0AAI9AGP8_9BACT|nr:DUF523 domain-containing protein [Caminibacter mediatlanticus]EDM23296.1 hypothetical protein CMTB2_06346 [Caminibacter mediatlanticus TB-2]
MKKAMISECMLGVACRYDGKSKPLDEKILEKLKEKYELIPFCPESFSLPTPRPPARFIGDRIIDINGIDKTAEFLAGAREALRICKENNIKIFIGKEKSPSCGVKKTSAYVNGCECKCDAPGFTSKLLKEEGIELISEWDLSS